MTQATYPKYRLVPANIPQGALCLQKFDGMCSGGPIWRTLDTMKDHDWAADRLAVCLGQMTADECAKRVLARKRAKKRLARELARTTDEELQSRYRLPGVMHWRT